MKAQTVLRLTVAFVIASFFLLYSLLEKQTQEDQRLSTPSVFNSDSGGLSAFHEFAKKVKPGVLKVSENAILESSELENADSVMLFSPSAEISKREAKLLYDFAESGHRLIISFQDEETWKENLAELTTLLKPALELEKVSDFKNGHAVEVIAPVDVGPYFKGETYAFYSSRRFAGDTCKQSPFFCYVQEVTVGTGKILFIAGFPPVSNGLIDRVDNRKVIFRLLEESRRLYIDEYHHFYSSKTLTDLLTYPPFIFPVGGLVIGLLMYFLLAHTKFRDRTLKGPGKQTVKSYHALSSGILDKMMSSPGLLQEVFAKQVEFLDNLFPEKKEELRALINQMSSRGINDPHFRILELTRFHQNILHQKGRR